LRSAMMRAVKSARGPGELNDALFKSDLRASLEAVLDDTAKRMGVDQAEIRRVLGDETVESIYNSLGPAIKARDLTAADLVFDQAYTVAQKHLDELTRETYDALAEHAAARIQAEGPTSYLRLMSDMVNDDRDLMEGYLKRLDARASEIRGMGTGQGAAWESFFNDFDNHLRRQHGNRQSYIEGLVQAGKKYGADVDEGVVSVFRADADATEAFFRSRRSTLGDFFAKKFESTETRRVAWEAMRERVNVEYGQLIRGSHARRAELDGFFTRIVDASHPEMTPTVVAWRKTVNELRRQSMDATLAFHKKVGAEIDVATKKMMHEAFNRQRLEWTNRIYKVETEGLSAIATGRQFGTIYGLDPDTLKVFDGFLATVGADDLSGTLNRRVEQLVQGGATPELAAKIARADLEHARSGRTLGGQLEVYWGLDPKAETAGVQKANIALRDAEMGGAQVTDRTIRQAAGQISDKEIRTKWVNEAESALRARQSGYGRQAQLITSEWHATAPGRPAERVLELHNTTGGSTWNPVRGHSMSRADGYAVSVFPERSVTIKGDVTPEALEDFVRANQDLLSHPSANLGTRKNGDATVLDVSIVVSDRRTALRLGKQYGQEAIYHLRAETPEAAEIAIKGRRTTIPTGDVMSRLEGVSSDFDELTLTRYTREENLPWMRVVDPQARTGYPAEEIGRRRAFPELWEDRLNYYRSGATPEPDVVAANPYKHNVTIVKSRLATSADIDGMRTAVSRQLTEAGELPVEARVTNMIDQQIKAQGYAGYMDDRGRVVLFEDMRTGTRLPEPPAVMRRRVQTVRDGVRNQIKEFSGQDDEMVDATMTVFDAYAAEFAKKTGLPEYNWWTERVQLREGMPPMLPSAEDPAGLQGWNKALSDGRVVIGLTEHKQADTLLHEVAEHWYRELPSQDREEIARWAATLPERLPAKYREPNEAFARAFIAYVTEGVTPSDNPLLATALRRMQRRFSSTTEAMANSSAFKLDDGVRDVIDRMLGMRRIQPGEPTIPSNLFDKIVPAPRPDGKAYDALWWKDGGEMFSSMRQSVRGALEQPPLRGDDILAGLPAEQRVATERALRAYAASAKRNMDDSQYAALRWGEMRRDMGLLDYRSRTYFDNGVAHAAPFGFWTTHTAWNWAISTIDRPAMLAHYMRMKQFLTTAGQANMPARFAGSMPLPGIELPFLPDDFGAPYINPLRIGWPMDLWSAPIEQQIQAGTSIDERAVGILERMVQDGQITQTAYTAAIASRSGEDWNMALQKAREGMDGFDPMDAMSSLVSPHAPLMWAYHLARGTPEEIGPFLPATRTIKGISSLFGAPNGGWNIEGWFRGKLGLPRYDRWDEYRAGRQLSGMVAIGMVSQPEAARALAEKGENEVWQLAVDRAGQEYGLSVLGGTLGIPLRAYPDGEREDRASMEGFFESIRLENEGHEGAMRRFLDDHPEVQIRLSLNDTPEEQMRTFLVDQAWDAWNGMTQLERNTVSDVLGEKFQQAFLDKETRAYGAITNDELSIWLKRMGGEPVGSYQAPAIEFPPPEVSQRAETYYQTRRAYFPDWFDVQSGYFRLEKGAARREYLAQNPSLRSYWQWSDSWLLRNPTVAPYIKDEEDLPLYESVAAMEQAFAQEPNFTPEELRQYLGRPLYSLVVDAQQGFPLTAAAREQLQRVADKLGVSVEALTEPISGP